MKRRKMWMRDIDLQSMDDLLLGNEEQISISTHNFVNRKKNIRFYKRKSDGALGGSIVRAYYI